MKHSLRHLLFTMAAGLPLGLSAQTETQPLFVHLADGSLDVFPAASMKRYAQTADSLLITLASDSVVGYALADVAQTSLEAPANLPVFTSFKFNNKYNDQVYTDVIATLENDSTVTAVVPAIGKRLTPSFQTSDALCLVFLDGKVQTSKVSRPRFDHDLVYTLGREGWRQMSFVKTKDEVWTTPSGGETVTSIPLTVDMLSTNAPSNYEDEEGLAMMLDGDISTYFHSTWGTGTYEKLPTDECAYVQVDLNEAIDHLQFSYTTRPSSARYPTAWAIQVSADGTTWTEAAAITSGLPTAVSTDYTSPTIDLGGTYSHLRFVQTSTNYKNYLALAEFALSIVVINETGSDGPVLISPAEWQYSWMPYGREVTVKTTWPTDTATMVPKLYVDVVDGQMITSKEIYLRAKLTIDGAGIWPGLTDSISIRGRGNSSWSNSIFSKNPYRIKFDVKRKPFGLTAGKSWVLLANKQTGSMMTNAVAMKVANLVGTEAANDMIPVELYLNGEYRGSYNFTQQVGFSNNSVNLPDESDAVLLELDTYSDPCKFYDTSFNLPVNIKEPDLEENPDADRQTLIQNDWNAFSALVAGGTDAYTDRLNVDAFARFWFVNDYVLNMEPGHPKSTFLYREDLLALHSTYTFGPVWDFDWAYGYDGSYAYCQSGATKNVISNLASSAGGRFFEALRSNSELVKRAYYRVWKDFMENHHQEVIEFVDDYLAFANPSFLHNAETRSDGSDYATNAANMKAWLNERSAYLYANLDTFADDDVWGPTSGDVNGDGFVTVADAVCVANHILGLENESFNATEADADTSGKIDVNDIVHVVSMALRQSSLATSGNNLPRAAAALRLSPFSASAGFATGLDLTIATDSATNYSAAQFEVVVPDGMTLTEASVADVPCRISFNRLDDGRYRVALYAQNGHTLPEDGIDLSLTLQADNYIPQPLRVVSIDGGRLATAKGEDQRLSPRSVTFDMATTGISLDEAVVTEGGNGLTVKSDKAGSLSVYTPDGRLARTVRLKSGHNHFDLPAGVYIVGRHKVVVNP